MVLEAEKVVMYRCTLFWVAFDRFSLCYLSLNLFCRQSSSASYDCFKFVSSCFRFLLFKLVELCFCVACF